VWISGLKFGGIPLECIVVAASLEALVFCEQIEQEILANMTKKFQRSPDSVRQQMSPFLTNALTVHVPGILSGICRDPKDDFILECATIVQADYIVTGDKDLLSLEHFGSTQIVTPHQFLDIAAR